MPFMRCVCWWMISSRRRSASRISFGLFQQLRRVADRRQRIADLVGEAGREAAERRQGQRLGVAREQRGVVEEDQRLVAVGEQAREARHALRAGPAPSCIGASSCQPSWRQRCRRRVQRRARARAASRCLRTGVPATAAPPRWPGGSRSSPSTSSTPVRMRRMISSLTSARLAASRAAAFGQRRTLCAHLAAEHAGQRGRRRRS